MLRDGWFRFWGFEAIFTSQGITRNSARPRAAKVWPAKLLTGRQNFYMIDVRRFRKMCTMAVQSHTRIRFFFRFFSSLSSLRSASTHLNIKQASSPIPVFHHVPLVSWASSSLQSEANSKILTPEMILCRRQQRIINTSKYPQTHTSSLSKTIPRKAPLARFRLRILPICNWLILTSGPKSTGGVPVSGHFFCVSVY